MRDNTSWFNENWWISPWNYQEEVRKNFNLPSKVFVRDSTIREGEETPGVSYTLEQKLDIAKKLEEIGVRHIDCGYVGKVKDHWDCAKKIKEIGLKLITYCHLSSNPSTWTEEINNALDAEIDYIGFGIVLTPWQLKLFTGEDKITPEVMISLIPSVLKRIKRLGGKAILDCVDATRSEFNLLKEAILKGIKNNVKMIMLYDTVGACNIPAITWMVRELKKIVGNTPLGIHVHDDFGLGTASTIAAVEQGVEYMDLVVNKLGDRAGNTSFEEVIVALEMLYGMDTGINLSKLYDLSKYVEKVSGIPLPFNKPVVGRNTFIHESELHVMSAMKKEKYWMCFTPYRPDVVGQEEKIIFGPTTLHGEAIKIKCRQLGYENFDEKIPKILSIVHDLIKSSGYITENQLEDIIKKILE